MDKENDIELYESREAGELIGYVPSALQKWGIYVIALFVLILFAGSYFFKYPETLKGSIIIPPSDSSFTVSGKLFLPALNIGEVEKGAKVRVFTDAYPEVKYGFLLGVVRQIKGIPDSFGLYVVDVDFPNGLTTSQGVLLSTHLQLTGTGEVILKDSRLIEVLISNLDFLSLQK